MPTGWRTARLKHVSTALPGGTPDTSVDDYWLTDDTGIPWISIGDMSGRKTITTTGKSLTERGFSSKTLPLGRPSQILFAMYASVGEVSILDIEATWNQALLGINPVPTSIDGQYLYYVLKAVNGRLPELYRSNTQNNLNADQVSNFEVPVPPLDDQKIIGEYLNEETARIDELIAKQERLIELLAEKRQAIITHAVTHGLDPSAPIKPSDTPSLGDLPAHWSHCQLKQAAIKVTDGAHVSPETENGEYDFVSTKDMGQSGIDFEGSLKTSAESYQSLVLAGCQPHAGDLLFSKDGTIGRTTVVNENREFVVASSLIIIRPNADRVFNKYLDFACQSKPIQSQVSSYTKGAGLPRLSIASLRRVRIPLPPLHEQMDIAENLAARTSTIDHLRRCAHDVIGLLRERRSALISAAVTGKINVREGAA
nr:restriction endonuclease subunit S [Arthrobacter sp. zg-Y895]